MANVLGDELAATAIVTSGDGAVSGNYKIHFAAIDMYYEGYNAPNGQTEYHFDMLDMANNGQGLDFEIDANSTETFNTTFDWPFTIEGNEQEQDNVRIICFIQNHSTREVIQAEWSELSVEYLFTASSEVTSELIEPSSSAEFTIDLANLGTEDDIYDITVTSDIPTGWTFEYTTPDGNQSGNSTISIASLDSYTCLLTFESTDVTWEEADVEMNIASQGLPEINYTLDFYVQNSGRVLVVNGDPDGNFTEYYDNVLTYAENQNQDDILDYGIWGRPSECLNTGDLAGMEIDLVIWYFGTGNTISDEQQDDLIDYLNNGGTLFINGSNAPAVLDDSDLIGMMGANYQGRYEAADNVYGESGDPFFGELNFYIRGGDGADNADEPCSLLPSGDGEVAFRYSTVRRAGMRMETDNYRTLLTGFPFEAINAEADRQAFMMNTLFYLIEYPVMASPDGEENASPDIYALNQNYPNPFNPSTEIAYELPALADVMLTVYNVEGRVVAELVNGPVEMGQHSVTWNASNMPSGVYFYKLEARGSDTVFSQTRKMLLIK